MACKSCSTGACGSISGDQKVSGCQSNGGCGSGGCNKMNVFDWLTDVDVPTFQRYPIVEIKFKGGRKEYFKNADSLSLHTGDAVMVDTGTGAHLGIVSLQGELVRLQLLKKGIKDDDSIKKILRLATEKDIEKHELSISKDIAAIHRSREIIRDLKLNMKLSDVEHQSDGVKATFYYSSDDRVDFRELIKVLANEFKVRIEMKQISLRQEAGRIGGIGICGRELCCSTWLTDFKNVTTSAARYQNLSLNPVKLSGQCGRLKCCLNYELETYMDAIKHIPTLEGKLKIRKGNASLQKTDIFKRMMWFAVEGEESNWVAVGCDRVAEIIELNKKGIIPESFENLSPDSPVVEKLSISELNSDLERMDKKYAKGGKRNPSQQKGGFRNERRDNRDQRPRDERQGNRDLRPRDQRPREDRPVQGPRVNPPGELKTDNANTNAGQEGNKPKKKFKKKFRPKPNGGNDKSTPSAE